MRCILGRWSKVFVFCLNTSEVLSWPNWHFIRLAFQFVTFQRAKQLGFHFILKTIFVCIFLNLQFSSCRLPKQTLELSLPSTKLVLVPLTQILYNKIFVYYLPQLFQNLVSKHILIYQNLLHYAKKLKIP